MEPDLTEQAPHPTSRPAFNLAAVAGGDLSPSRLRIEVLSGLTVALALVPEAVGGRA